jgi:hypothetical protein
MLEDNRLPKQLLKYHPKGRRRPGRPSKRLLDYMTAETETGHAGINSYWNVMMMMMMMTKQSTKSLVISYNVNTVRVRNTQPRP